MSIYNNDRRSASDIASRLILSYLNSHQPLVFKPEIIRAEIKDELAALACRLSDAGHRQQEVMNRIEEEDK